MSTMLTTSGRRGCAQSPLVGQHAGGRTRQNIGKILLDYPGPPVRGAAGMGIRGMGGVPCDAPGWYHRRLRPKHHGQ